MKRYTLLFFVMFLVIFISENAFAFELGNLLGGDSGSYEKCDSKATIKQIKKMIPKIPQIRLSTLGAELEVLEITDIKTIKEEKMTLKQLKSSKDTKFCSLLAKTSHGNYLIDYDIQKKKGKYFFHTNVSENNQNYLEKEKLSKQLNHLKTGTVSDIKRDGKLYEIYNMPGKTTSLKRKRMTDKITGKIVIWNLVISEIHLQEDESYLIESIGEYLPGNGEADKNLAWVQAKVKTSTNEQKDYIENLEMHSRITVKGIIDSLEEELTTEFTQVFMVNLNPAILFDERFVEKDKVPLTKKKVDCPSETDSLKRLTCYDNLPDNLKNKNCSSISDSLKRLSCFETKKKSEVAEEKIGGTASGDGCKNYKTNTDTYEKILYAIVSDDNYPDKELHRVSKHFKEYWEWEGDFKNEELEKKFNDSLFNLSKQGNGQASYIAGIIKLSEFKYEEATKYFNLSLKQKYLKGYDLVIPCWENLIRQNTRADGTWGGSKTSTGKLEGFDEIKKWKKLAANEGNTTAHNKIKILLEDILEKERLKKEAKEKAPLMAKQGDAHAQYILGKMYAKGEGVPQDYKEALKWYTKSAEQGYLEAQDFLGWLYRYGELNGIKVEKDYKEAVKWFRLVAEQGDRDAQYNLGTIYSEPDIENVPQDYKEALKWYTKAAKQGHLGAKKGMDYVSLKILEKERLEKEAAKGE